MSTTNNSRNENMIAWYPFDDTSDVGRDASGRGNTAMAIGTRRPEVQEVKGRKAAVFQGGEYGSSYLELPFDLLTDVNDNTGFTVSTWIYSSKAVNVWERIFDFGKNIHGPYLFLTRSIRGVCFAGTDLFADANLAFPLGEWVHVAMTVTGTKGGTLSSAGPRVYLNGELVADGFISQTSSGTYKKFREWFATLEDTDNYCHNYIGHSQFMADPDFSGAISDFRIYNKALSEHEITSLMCESLSELDILKLAKNKYLTAPPKIITKDLILPSGLMEDRVQVSWSFEPAGLISQNGTVTPAANPAGVAIKAVLTCGSSHLEKNFGATVMPEFVAPYELKIHGNKEVLDISKTLYGLFFEDINNAADGGIYAEMISNRSFEDFTYRVYDARSGENGISSGRNHRPLRFWFGDLDHIEIHKTGGLNEYFGLEDPDANAYYIEVPEGTRLYNRGFCDNTENYSMNLKHEEGYQFSIWAKADSPAVITVELLDGTAASVSNTVTVEVSGDGQWKQYHADKLVATETVMGQISLSFSGGMCIDMVSLMPDNVWGAAEEKISDTAHKNFMNNSNYRLRRDMVEVLAELHPTFLRFPGGCISEGSYIWDNVYDWKDSVGPVETRKENYNVWGYTMTLGLGYMEYFQLAEDLHAEPLPVMACGVLCQARSDYANPAGGSLQEKYISNFIDLIDFAISMDFENNKWAALRRDMGHEEAFPLHYLGVGNENWGSEFFASFEAFHYAIDDYMKQVYPDYELHIISTAGAQADDDAYQNGWKFLAGYMKGGDTIRFTDGKQSFGEEVTWYSHKKNYLDTIVDEHYYRSNDYLLENADRYNYYFRPYKNGKLIEDQVSKVFVGEYASSDKNTLAGAVAEAAVMTGFERNSDVVRLAATAPLFNKVINDGTYRWTPDAIWFDNKHVWRTPSYYVQQLFAKYIGKKLLKTSYRTYINGERRKYIPSGGISIAVAEGDLLLKKLIVTSNLNDEIWLEQDFTQELDPRIRPIIADDTNIVREIDGMLICSDSQERHGFYIDEVSWFNYTVQLIAEKKTDNAQMLLGTGLHGLTNHAFKTERLSVHEYCVGVTGHGTGLKVIKEGREGYRMGDYSSSVFAGNLRACYDEPVPAGQEYMLSVNYGGLEANMISCYYTDESEEIKGKLDCKLEAYTHDIYHSVTADEEKVYIKLVNAENFGKHMKVNLEHLNIHDQAELVTLTAEDDLVHIQNVNEKNNERVVPVTTRIPVSKTGFELIMPANSVNVVILNKNKNL